MKIISLRNERILSIDFEYKDILVSYFIFAIKDGCLIKRSLALFKDSEDIDFGSQSTDFFPEIPAECNGSDTRVPLGFMLSKLVVT